MLAALVISPLLLQFLQYHNITDAGEDKLSSSSATESNLA